MSHRGKDKSKLPNGNGEITPSLEEQNRLAMERLTRIKARKEIQKIDSELEKLAHDKEKTLIETKQLKRNVLLTPSTWIALAAVVGVILQIIVSNLTVQQATIDKKQALYDREIAIHDFEKAKNEVEDLKAKKSELASSIIRLKTERDVMLAEREKETDEVASLLRPDPSAPGGVALGKNTVSISGHVLNYNGKPIIGAEVTMVEEGKTVSSSTKTNADGYYILHLAKSNSVALLFDKDDYGKDILRGISAQKNQRIDKVLYRKDGEELKRLKELIGYSRTSSRVPQQHLS